MDHLLRIGQVCRLFGITPDTLRHYEKKGLLTPVTDPQNGYRYYTVDQLDTIELILHSRHLGIPLAELRQRMAAEDPEAYREMLCEQAALLREKIRALQTLVQQTDRRIGVLEELRQFRWAEPAFRPWAGAPLSLYRLQTDCLLQLTSDPPEMEGMETVETWRFFSPAGEEGHQEDPQITAFSFPPAQSPTPLEVGFQQLVQAELAELVTLEAPLDHTLFWGTEADLLACLDRLCPQRAVWVRARAFLPRRGRAPLAFSDCFALPHQGP